MTVYGASYIGREHTRVGRNNQDAFFTRAQGARSVAVVADGCGSSGQSEVGAQLGSRFLCSYLIQESISPALPQAGLAALTRWLGATASSLPGGHVDEVLEAYFLFTFLAVVREGAQCLVFGVGDGAVLVDGASTRLDAGPNNAPDYCAYGLSGSIAAPPVVVHFAGAAQQVVLLTDGFDPLLETQAVQQLVEGAAHWRNPLTLQRRLNVLAERERFSDDATMVVSVQ
jgi:serine/threonine protein phosphatase PrpC